MAEAVVGLAALGFRRVGDLISISDAPNSHDSLRRLVRVGLDLVPQACDVPADDFAE